MKYRLPDSVPVEADWGHPNYKDIVRGQRTFAESLPYPLVTYPDVYGTWLYFQKATDSPPRFCTCQRRPMVNFLRMNEAAATYRLYRGDSLLCHFLPRDIMPDMPMVAAPAQLEAIDLFRENICHRCLLKVPSVRWSNLPAHSAFVQHFGWYWKQALLGYGIDWYMPFLEDQCPEAIKHLLAINPWETHATIRAYSNQHGLNIYAFDHAPGELGSWRPGMNEMYELSQILRAVRSAVEKEVCRTSGSCVPVYRRRSTGPQSLDVRLTG